MFRALTPQDHVAPEELDRGLRAVLRDGLCTQGMGTLTTGVFLVGFGLSLGASNAVIGLLAALPFLANVLQIPAVILIERYRQRKRIAVTAALVSRLTLFAVALAPLLPSSGARLLLLAGIFVHMGTGSVAGSAWNSWMRDLIPEETRGDFFGRRLFLTTALAAVLSLVAGLGVDRFAGWRPEGVAWGYSALFAVGALSGLGGLFFLSRTPEPRLPARESAVSVVELLSRPFRDLNFRRLIIFLGSWNFAVNLAAPFFTVYMLTRLGFGLSFVVVAVVVSQAANLAVVQTFGRLTDQLSNRAVLGVCGPLFLVGILAWPLTTLPEKWAGTIPLVLGLHLLMGVAAAGLNLSSSNIALKLAPRGSAAPYLAAVALVNSVCAGLAPIIGGLSADFFASRDFAVVLRWSGIAGERIVETLSLRHWDFFFVLAALAGLYPLHRLSLVEEEGEVEEQAVLQALSVEMGRAVRNLSSVSGLRAITAFPIGLFRRPGEGETER